MQLYSLAQSIAKHRYLEGRALSKEVNNGDNWVIAWLKGL